MDDSRMVAHTKNGALKPVFQNTSVYQLPTHGADERSRSATGGFDEKVSEAKANGPARFDDRFPLCRLEKRVLQTAAEAPVDAIAVSRKLRIHPQTASRCLATLNEIGILRRKRIVRLSKFGPRAYVYWMAVS